MTTKLQMANAIMDANPWVTEEERKAGIEFFIHRSKNFVADHFRHMEELRIRCEKLGLEWPAKTLKDYWQYCTIVYGGSYTYEEAYALAFNHGRMSTKEALVSGIQ